MGPCSLSLQELETQYSPSMWSPRLVKDVIEAHIQATSDGKGPGTLEDSGLN